MWEWLLQLLGGIAGGASEAGGGVGTLGSMLGGSGGGGSGGSEGGIGDSFGILKMISPLDSEKEAANAGQQAEETQIQMMRDLFNRRNRLR